jgi:hypothetical protein
LRNVLGLTTPNLLLGAVEQMLLSQKQTLSSRACMSALGQKLPRRGQIMMSVLRPKAAAAVTDGRGAKGQKQTHEVQQMGRNSTGEPQANPD